MEGQWTREATMLAKLRPAGAGLRREVFSITGSPKSIFVVWLVLVLSVEFRQELA
jgi:hypothetical protein